MGHFSNKVARADLQPGDHIYCYRKLHTYSHHGIYVDHDRVIHYNPTQEASSSWAGGKQCDKCGHRSSATRGVVKTCVDCFLLGHGLRRFRYGVSLLHFLVKRSGTCTTGHSDSPAATIGRATDSLRSGFGEYHLLNNNCETFAIYCKTNKHMSHQSFSAMNKFKAVMKHNVEKLRSDVKVHQPHLHEKLKEILEKSDTLSINEILAAILNLNKKLEGCDHAEDVTEDKIDKYAKKLLAREHN